MPNSIRMAKIKPDGTIIFYINDPLGSPLILMDEDGNIVKRYRFDPFGNLEAQWGTEPNRYLFTGKEKDESGLYYFGARYYNPRLGRWITPEPRLYSTHPKLALSLKNPQGLNPYVYCFNNPLRYLDIEGKWELEAHARQFVEFARQYLGIKYKPTYGFEYLSADVPTALDCKALVGRALQDMYRAGVRTEIFAHWQDPTLFVPPTGGVGTWRLLKVAEAGKYGLSIVSWEKAKGGDLIIWATPEKGHVAIISEVDPVTGKIKVIEARGEKWGVVESREKTPEEWQALGYQVIRITEELEWWEEEKILKERCITD